MTTDGLEYQLVAEIRSLGQALILYERWAREAAEASRWQRVAEFHASRDQALERRSNLMRELWEYRRGE